MEKITLFAGSYSLQEIQLSGSSSSKEKTATVISVYDEAVATLKIELQDPSTPGSNRIISIPFKNLKEGTVFAAGNRVSLKLSVSHEPKSTGKPNNDAFLTLQIDDK